MERRFFSCELEDAEEKFAGLFAEGWSVETLSVSSLERLLPPQQINAGMFVTPTGTVFVSTVVAVLTRGRWELVE
jgi:hypothetical protein